MRDDQDEFSHQRKLIMCKKEMCAPELVLHVMRQFTLSSDFYFKAIRSIKTGRERNRRMAKTQGRRVLSPTRISPTHREQSHPWGLQRWHERQTACPTFPEASEQ